MSQNHSENKHTGAGSSPSSQAVRRGGPATAPYNFIPYDPEKTVSSPPDDGKAYTGVIRCRLHALTPLLVAGPQGKKRKEKKDNDRRFFTVNGQPIIPGTSLKGMLRSLVEIISHSHLSPVNGDKLFRRKAPDKKGAAYKKNFPADDAILGGFLHRKGSRYSRVAYHHTVRELAGECPNDDFAAALFGSVGQVIRKGRVAVGAARFSTWKQDKPVTAILMTPHPTCLLHYLEQPNARDCGNKLDELETYDSPGARLRGRKYYWHCKSVRHCPDHLKSKSSILSRLHPLAAGAEAQFEIRVDGVSGVELGALLMALELPQGHAHKLGLGKAVGLGSVRLEVEDVLVQPRRERYASLRDRLAGGPVPLTAAVREELKAAFQDYVSTCMGQTYEQLEAVRTLLVMTDFDHCPHQEKTAPMPLEEKGGRPGFASKARLPSALEVWNGR